MKICGIKEVAEIENWTKFRNVEMLHLYMIQSSN